jgi:hypothetical protein
VEDCLTAIPADPRGPARLRLPIGKDRDRPIHANPTLAVAVFEAGRLLAQDPELSVVHRDLREGLLFSR